MIEEVDAITHIQDPVLRNLRITLCYSEISNAVTRLTGGGANWSTFATWASKQAGVSIRKEDLRRQLESAFDSDPEITAKIDELSRLFRTLGRFVDRSRIHAAFRRFMNRLHPIERVSDATARGNLKVFSEIAREFARFLDSWDGAQGYDQTRVDNFCKALRDGEPPDGQRLLKRAFTSYFAAIYEADVNRKQQLLFLANTLIGLHEQTRLQPEINDALNAPVLDPLELQREILDELGLFGSVWLKLKMMRQRLLNGPTLLDKAVDQLTMRARKVAHAVITDHLLTIGLANGSSLRLGRDLTTEFPASLQTITNADAQELLRRIDRTPDSTREAGAEDWADFSDRMHFIVDFFRCYHEDKTLFEAPFTSTELEALTGGKMSGKQVVRY